MDGKEKKIREQMDKAQAKVDRLNHVFDKVVLPVLLFTVGIILVLMIFGNSFFDCVNSCSGALVRDNAGAVSQSSTSQRSESDKKFYAKRQKFMSDMAGNREKLEAAGYVVSDDYDASLTARREYEDALYYSIDYFSGGEARAITRVPS